MGLLKWLGLRADTIVVPSVERGLLSPVATDPYDDTFDEQLRGLLEDRRKLTGTLENKLRGTSPSC